MQYFYQPDISKGLGRLQEEEFRHCCKALRHVAGDRIGVFDGKGTKYEAEITLVEKSSCSFCVLSEDRVPPKPFYNHVAIAPTKNTDRMEWFVEKAGELGADEISFVLAKNCERGKINIGRLVKKAISALKQSKSGFLTKVNELEKFDIFLDKNPAGQKFIGHISEGAPYISHKILPGKRTLALVGPEGGFTEREIALAESRGFEKVLLGQNTLRTETAGLAAAHAVNASNEW